MHAPGFGRIRVQLTDEGFSILKGNRTLPVQRHNIDKIRDITPEQLKGAAGKVYLQVTGDEETPKITSHVRGPGGAGLGALFVAPKAGALGAAAGAVIGGPVGMAVGGAIGTALGTMIGGIFLPF